MRRAAAYNRLKEYDIVVHDYTEVIRLQPNAKAYVGRASAEDVLGDAAGAAAGRSHARESRKKKRD
jgi:hypothetical protein